jgi:hypothetical protein
MDIGQGPHTAALYGAVRDEIRGRESTRNE